MKILALDSTAICATAAVCEDEKLLCQITLNNGNTHSETLLPMVEFMLRSLALSVHDMDLLALSEGPGSFTGVRIGAATVKGLAFGTDIPCLGVSTLEALAYNLKSFSGILCPVMNARRSQLYNALFDCDSRTVTRLCEDRAIAISDLDAELASLGRPVFLCGDGTDLALGAFKTALCQRAPETLVYQNAYSVAQCALAKYQTGIRTKDTELVPTYLRLPQAERERLEREQKKNENI